MDRKTSTYAVSLVGFVLLLALAWRLFPLANPAYVPVRPIVVVPVQSTTTTQKLVALTFDDGPYGTSTRQILDILKEKKVPATFFVLGMNVEKFPEEAKRIVQEGHLIGNHTYNHSMALPNLTAVKFALDLDKTERIIETATGQHAVWFRPPYGTLSDAMRAQLKKEGFLTALWNIDPEDWNYEKSPTKAIVANVLAHLKPDAIILMHDGRDTKVNYPRDNTVNALPILIDEIRAKGYTFVTVDRIVK